jgi:hypothetical protein
MRSTSSLTALTAQGGVEVGLEDYAFPLTRERHDRQVPYLLDNNKSIIILMTHSVEFFD